MSGFAELCAAVQVGVQRTAPETRFGLEPVERAVLVELGTVALQRRAGHQARPAAPLPECPPEILRVAEGAADALLEAMEGSVDLVLEWAREAARKGFVLPPSVLSRALHLSERRSLVAVLGTRGRWLAETMEIDLKAPPLELPAKEEWDALDVKARVFLLENDPTEDVPFFEKALADRKKDVREAAADRLIRISASPAAETLQRMGREALVVKRGLLRKGIEIKLPNPDELPKWLPKASALRDTGPGAMALFDLVSHIPPGFWDEAPDTLLDLVKGSDHQEILVHAWRSAAVRFGDQAWIDAFLSRINMDRLQSQSAIFQHASGDIVEKTALSWLKFGRDGLFAVANMLILRQRPISATLSRALVEATARQDLTESSQLYELNYHLTPLGKLLDLSVLPKLEDGLAESLAQITESWRKFLSLRRRLHESLQ